VCNSWYLEANMLAISTGDDWPSTTLLTCYILSSCLRAFRMAAWYWALVLRMTSATIPLQGLPQSSHILCQNKELFLSRSMNSVHPGIQTRVPRHLGNGIVSFVITGKQLQSDLHIRWDYQYAQCLCNTRLHTKYQTKATQYLLTWCVRFPYTQLYACWWP